MKDRCHDAVKPDYCAKRTQAILCRDFKRGEYPLPAFSFKVNSSQFEFLSSTVWRTISFLGKSHEDRELNSRDVLHYRSAPRQVAFCILWWVRTQGAGAVVRTWWPTTSTMETVGKPSSYESEEANHGPKERKRAVANCRQFSQDSEYLELWSRRWGSIWR